MKKTNGLRTWIEISAANLKHNVELFQQQVVPNKKIMAIVKSNAYGHGFVDFAQQLELLKVDHLGVDSISEALRLRKEGITIPILVLGHTLPEWVKEAVDHDITLTVSTMGTLKAWTELYLLQPIPIHLKIDTGLHRQGFMKHELHEVLDFLETHGQFYDVAGLYTHFAKAKDPNDRVYTEKQISEFNTWVEAFKNAQFGILVHACATGGTLLYPEAHYDMVRIGAGFCGIWPSDEIKKVFNQQFELKPVLTWKTLIVEKKHIQKGEGIGYDLIEILQRDSVVAICPIGYWHGIPRKLSTIGSVLVNGKRAKILGKISMDMLAIDVTDIFDIQIYDEAVVIGVSGQEEISIRDLAELAGTTTYEFITRVNPRIKKIYV
ncbi:MAG: alanine racemase [bacterium]|nr:alanine racemase [bacterium]